MMSPETDGTVPAAHNVTLMTDMDVSQKWLNLAAPFNLHPAVIASS